MDDTPVWPADRHNDMYPVRIELTRIQDINQAWYRGDGWRDALEDRYFTERSLYVLRQSLEDQASIHWQVLFGTIEAK